MNPIALLFNGVWSHYVFATAPKYRDIYRMVYIHEFNFEAIADCVALVIPFGSDQAAIGQRQDAIYRFLAHDKKVACFGNTSADWIDARWEHRPTNNWWWKEDPNNPPIAKTDFTHPLFNGLQQRHACWHTHGAYTRIPENARVLQTNGDGEFISWQTHAHGGTLFASTLDPIVEHGVQQVAHLDNFCDSLTRWLAGVRPRPGKLTVDTSRFGVALDEVA